VIQGKPGEKPGNPFHVFVIGPPEHLAQFLLLRHDHVGIIDERQEQDEDQNQDFLGRRAAPSRRLD
jgi:hypothetical protein